MWCAKCQADVAAEVTPDHMRVRCATCGTMIKSVSTPPVDRTREARELLEKWSTIQAAASKSTKGQGTSPKPAEASLPRFRVDASHPAVGQQPSAANPAPQEAVDRRFHTPHAAETVAPHFELPPLPPEEKPAEANSQTFWGQILAYAGVLALTVGGVMVLLGYFGGSSWQAYAPTGWLITTIGQMLLFLGVVTLVSGGMEHTTDEVSRRIDRIGHRMIRIEMHANHALRGPSIPAERFAGDNAAPAQTAGSMVNG